jgi:large subunit ribosomal protein L7A
MSTVHELADPKRRVAGLKQVLRLSHQRELEKVFVAKDADEDIVAQLRRVCGDCNIPCDMSLSMHQIGIACGIEVGSACAGVLRAKR